MPAPQVVVALLESLQEGGPVSAAAIRVLEELVLIFRRTHRDKLRTIPPLPNWLPELEKLNEVGACAHTHAEVGGQTGVAGREENGMQSSRAFWRTLSRHQSSCFQCSCTCKASPRERLPVF